MSEPKFTPGPWRIGTPPPNGEQTIGTVVGLMVAVATTGVGMAEETKANAHLIAAAPDLYRELELARFTIAMEIATMGPRTLDREEKEALIAEHPTIKSIDAALAKARGESHD